MTIRAFPQIADFPAAIDGPGNGGVSFSPGVLEALNPMQSGCLLLDVRPSGSSGLELLECINTPSVHAGGGDFRSGNVRAVVRGMRAGALDFLQKPCRNRALREAIRECFGWDAANRRRLASRRKYRAGSNGLPRANTTCSCKSWRANRTKALPTIWASASARWKFAAPNS